MQKENSGFFPAQFESCDMSCQQVNQKQTTDDVPAGKPGNSPDRSRRCEKKKQTLEIAVFRLIDADVDLIQGAEKHQHHRTGQTDDGQLERGERFQPAKEFTRHSLILAWSTRRAPGFLSPWAR